MKNPFRSSMGPVVIWVAFVSTQPAMAQRLPPEVQSASRVRIIMDGGRFGGVVSRVEEGRLRFSLDCASVSGRECPRPLVLDSIDRLDVAVGNHAARGGLIGFLAAVGFGVWLAATEAGQSDLGTGGLLATGVASAVLTVPVGAIIGAGTTRWRTVYRRDDPPSVRP